MQSFIEKARKNVPKYTLRLKKLFKSMSKWSSGKTNFPAGCWILYTLLFLTYFEVEIFYMPFAMASEDPLYVNKWTKFWILYWNLRPYPNQQYTRAAFIQG